MSGISVVIPCYRCAPTIGRAVESVAAQTLRPLEVILVDDASPDDTPRVIAAIAARHESGWVRVVSLEQNQGAGEARNRGWAEARGEYIAFLDADDAWHPRKLELQLAFMAAHPRVHLCGHAHAVRPDGRLDTSAPVDGHALVSSTELLLRNRFVTPSVMVRRSVMLRFPRGKRYMEDHYLWTRIAYEGLGVARLDATLATTFKHTFADRGLASNLIGMELGELDNYVRLFRENCIGFCRCAAMCLLSTLRFMRRCLIVLAHRAAGNRLRSA
jgi:teichuronic acid biosynthesis glycosyltransferase TuaG